MAEEWAYELTGPCGCAGDQRISESTNPFHRAIWSGIDEAGEWLTVRLPPQRLNERDRYDDPPLIGALRSHTPLPRTVAALLSRMPDVDLTPRETWSDGEERSAAELLGTRYAPQWLPPHLAAELKLKTEQFGAQYLPSAAVLCVQSLQSRQSHESMGSAVCLPRELVRLVLQYTALPQPNPWPNAHADAHAEPDAPVRDATAASAAASAL